MVQGIPGVSIPGATYSTVHIGKMSFPVDSSSLIYSHFEHVSGVPAQNATEGVAISKLNLLDVLIGQINQINKNAPVRINADPTGGVDSLIENMTNQIANAKAMSEAMPYIPFPGAESGALFSIIA
jgi:hypothetical protein